MKLFDRGSKHLSAILLLASTIKKMLKVDTTTASGPSTTILSDLLSGLELVDEEEEDLVVVDTGEVEEEEVLIEEGMETVRLLEEEEDLTGLVNMLLSIIETNQRMFLVDLMTDSETVQTSRGMKWNNKTWEVQQQRDKGPRMTGECYFDFKYDIKTSYN